MITFMLLKNQSLFQKKTSLGVSKPRAGSPMRGPDPYRIWVSESAPTNSSGNGHSLLSKMDPAFSNLKIAGKSQEKDVLKILVRTWLL